MVSRQATKVALARNDGSRTGAVGAVAIAEPRIRPGSVNPVRRRFPETRRTPSRRSSEAKPVRVRRGGGTPQREGQRRQPRGRALPVPPGPRYLPKGLITIYLKI